MPEPDRSDRNETEIERAEATAARRDDALRERWVRRGRDTKAERVTSARLVERLRSCPLATSAASIATPSLEMRTVSADVRDKIVMRDRRKGVVGPRGDAAIPTWEPRLPQRPTRVKLASRWLPRRRPSRRPQPAIVRMHDDKTTTRERARLDPIAHCPPPKNDDNKYVQPDETQVLCSANCRLIIKYLGTICRLSLRRP